MLARMIDPAKLSKQQLLDLVQDQVAKLEANQTQLADRETQLSAQSKELAQDKDQAWTTTEARARLMGFVGENIRAFNDGAPINVVS